MAERSVRQAAPKRMIGSVGYILLALGLAVVLDGCWFSVDINSRFEFYDCTH